MGRGPAKQFDPDVVLETAMKLFWAKGYAATGMAELQQAMGIGRKSMYDTFGNKRDLYLKTARLYADQIIEKFRESLLQEGSPIENVRRMLRRIEQANCQPGSPGCFMGVTMAQFTTEDEDVTEIVQSYLKRLERLFYQVFMRAQDKGELSAQANVRDLARLFTNIVTGMTLIGRVTTGGALQRGTINAAISLLGAT